MTLQERVLEAIGPRGLTKAGYLTGSSMSLSLKYPPESPK